MTIDEDMQYTRRAENAPKPTCGKTYHCSDGLEKTGYFTTRIEPRIEPDAIDKYLKKDKAGFPDVEVRKQPLTDVFWNVR